MFSRKLSCYTSYASSNVDTDNNIPEYILPTNYDLFNGVSCFQWSPIFINIDICPERVSDQSDNELLKEDDDSSWTKILYSIKDYVFDRYGHFFDDTKLVELCNQGPGLCGLTNLGNTCYMNSGLQCLSHIRPLTEFALKQNNSENDLFGIYCRLIKHLWSGQTCFRPLEFRSAISRRFVQFSGTNQNDCSEFLTSVLDRFHEDLLNRNSKSNNFVGNYESYEDYISNNRTVISENCHIFQKFQLSCNCGQVLVQKKHPSLVLNLPQFKLEQQFRLCLSYLTLKILISFSIKNKNPLIIINMIMSLLFICLSKKTNLYNLGNFSNIVDNFYKSIIGSLFQEQTSPTSLDKCLDNYIAVRKMNSEDKIFCSNCQMDVCPNEQTTIEYSPKVLILQLKNNHCHQTIASSYTCEFPLELDFKNYVSGEQNKSKLIYDLIAVSNYNGSAKSGHYTAYAKNHKTNKWFEFNDSYVCEISKNNLVSPRAYLLFYLKR